MIQKTGVSLRSATLADKNTNTTKEISLVAFFLSVIASKASLRDAIRKRMRGTAIAVEGACVTWNFRLTS